MSKIIHRNITNEDGDVYGVIGDITRLGAYRAIRQDLREYGILEDIMADGGFNQDDLETCDFWETEDPEGDCDGWIWWAKPPEKYKSKYLGTGWVFRPY